MRTPEREQLIIQNLELPRKLAGAICRRNGRFQDYEDLVSEGNIRLVEAADRFDLNARAKFSTFAYQNVQGALYDFYRKSSRCLNKVILNDLRSIAKADDALEQRLERTPTYEELAQATGLGVERVKFVRHRLYSAFQHSLSEPLINHKEDVLWGDVAKDPHDYEQEVVDKVFWKWCESQLTERERLILRRLLQGCSLYEIAKEFDVNASRISQIKKSIILFLQQER